KYCYLLLDDQSSTILLFSIGMIVKSFEPDSIIDARIDEGSGGEFLMHRIHFSRATFFPN
ncbi:MAG: hypothetical protein WAM26_03685, partial [Nitrososphaeraceae archaeon]